MKTPTVASLIACLAAFMAAAIALPNPTGKGFYLRFIPQFLLKLVVIFFRYKAKPRKETGLAS
jgi:hypothetical protein